MLEFADVATNLAPLQEVVKVNTGPAVKKNALAALAVGLAAFGSGYAERGIGAAAVGALAEDSISLGNALLMTVLPETLVILALLTFFLG